MKPTREKWARNELIVAFNLYCRTPFGRIHKSNPMIIELANKIGRTPSAVAMKMVNFASLDPTHQLRNVKGLQHGSKQDEYIWKEFHEDWQGLASESQRVIHQLSKTLEQEEILDFSEPSVTEVERSVKVRLVQRFFRDTVLASYNFNCALCKMSLPAMLNASHIIPWAVNKQRRADPRNGICLCALHDRAFDRGLITICEDFKIAVSREIKIPHASKLHRVGLLDIEGEKINLPDRFMPDPEALAYHREKIFLQ
jgi:putative restriction endonuclease